MKDKSLREYLEIACAYVDYSKRPEQKQITDERNEKCNVTNLFLAATQRKTPDAISVSYYIDCGSVQKRKR